MKIQIKKCLFLGIVLMAAFALSGCFFTEQEITVNEDGKATVQIDFWFKQEPMGAANQGAIAMRQLLYLFPEIQDYERDKTTRKETEEVLADEYDVYTFVKHNVELNENEYIDFDQKPDGSYYFQARIPKVLSETVKESDNEKILVIRLTLPAEIDMANSMNYGGNTVEWELRTNDFARDVTLKAFTKS